MRGPPTNASSETLLEDYGNPHLDKLQADRSLAELATAFGNVVRGLTVAHDGRLASERAAEAAEEAAVAAERPVDTELRSLNAILFSAVGRKSGAMPYVHVFPQGGAAAVAPRGRAQVAEARRVISQIGSIPAEHASKVPVECTSIVARLSEATGVLETKCVALEAAIAAVATATSSELLERRRFREAYRRSEAQLLVEFNGDQKKVDSYFPKPSGPKKKPKKTPGGGDPPGGS